MDEIIKKNPLIIFVSDKTLVLSNSRQLGSTRNLQKRWTEGESLVSWNRLLSSGKSILT